MGLSPEPNSCSQPCRGPRPRPRLPARTPFLLCYPVPSQTPVKLLLETSASWKSSSPGVQPPPPGTSLPEPSGSCTRCVLSDLCLLCLRGLSFLCVCLSGMTEENRPPNQHGQESRLCVPVCDRKAASCGQAEGQGPAKPQETKIAE